jgi:hypothetical protein
VGEDQGTSAFGGRKVVCPQTKPQRRIGIEEHAGEGLPQVGSFSPNFGEITPSWILGCGFIEPVDQFGSYLRDLLTRS